MTIQLCPDIFNSKVSTLCMCVVCKGTDPGTDLRGTGFLGLMHALYFVMDPEILPLARDIYKLSQHPVQVIFRYTQWTPPYHAFIH